MVIPIGWVVVAVVLAIGALLLGAWLVVEGLAGAADRVAGGIETAIRWIANRAIL